MIQITVDDLYLLIGQLVAENAALKKIVEKLQQEATDE